jgi:hypothetical protein
MVRFSRADRLAPLPFKPNTMRGKLVSLFFPAIRRGLRCIATHTFAAPQHPRIKNQRGEISSLDVWRERAMLLAKKMFRDFAGFVPGPTGSSKMFGRNT